MKINELLNENQNHDYQYGMIDSNHAPMTLLAMHKIGASEQELEDYFNSIKKDWSTKKLDISDTCEINRKNYTQYYGQLEYFSRFVDFFSLELKRNGLIKVLETYLPEFVFGPASAAYHPMIRLAYGIEFNDEQECVHALAY